MAAPESSTSLDAPLLPRSESPTGSPRSASVSLQAAATMNAGLQHEPGRQTSSTSLSRHRHSPSTGRRKSAVLMNLLLNDPSVPAPGEMVTDSDCTHSTSGSPLLMGRDPYHHRAPSLGELHQELEEEQEGHVNRLLNMIRQQQQANLHQNHGSDESGPSSHGHGSLPPLHTQQSHASSQSTLTTVSPARIQNAMYHPRSSFDSGRRPRASSRATSPHLRSTSISLESSDGNLGGRDESVFYQAETQMLTRENQMLRLRIRELEKQLADITSPTGGATHEPAQHSHLSLSQTVGPAAKESSSADASLSNQES